MSVSSRRRPVYVRLACVALIAASAAALAAPSPAGAQYVQQAAWGSFGTGNGQFEGLTGIAADAEGNVYAGDLEGSRIEKFSSNGAFLGEFGSEGHGAGQFDGPSDVAIDPSGNAYVVDANNKRVEKFDSSGNFEIMWGWGVADGFPMYETCTSSCQVGLAGSGSGQFDFPLFDATDSSGNIYVADSGNDRIDKFSPGLASFSSWGSSGSGNSQFNEPEGIAVDNSAGPDQGDVYVADGVNDRIEKFSPTGSFITAWGTFGSGDGQFNFPHGVATDQAGNVYVVDYGNDRIEKFSSTGTFLETWGSSGSGVGQLSYPDDVAVDAAGNVYVSDTGNSRIVKYVQVPPANPSNPVSPSNEFTIGKVKKAKLSLTLASAGSVRIAAFTRKFARKGAHPKPPIEPSDALGGPGTIQVPLKLTGSSKATLRLTGKLKFKTTVTFTPTGGDPNTKTAVLKLRGHRKRR